MGIISRRIVAPPQKRSLFSNAMDPYFSSVVLLLSRMGPHNTRFFEDRSIQRKVPSVLGDSRTDATKVKFDTPSLYLDGAGDYLQFAASNDWYFGTNNFTIEAWINTSQGSGTYVPIITTGPSAWSLYTRFDSANSIDFTFNDGRWRDMNTGVSASDGFWHHIAVTRASGVFRIFKDGSIILTNSSLTGNNVGANIYVNVGFNPWNVQYYQGNIDEIRVTKGVARYTDNFVPSWGPFPTE